MNNKPTPDTGTLPGTALETYGTVFSQNAGRDAIHLATVAVTSDERLYPGQHIGMLANGKVSQAAPKLIGIVDPFLKDFVVPGQYFWLTLYPRTITSLRHAWTHPAFGEADADAAKIQQPEPKRDAAESEAWLRKWIAGEDVPDYETIMEAIRTGSSIGRDGYGDKFSVRLEDEYIQVGGMDANGSIPPEFWEHVEVVLGHPPRAKPSYFSCSC